MYFSHFKFNPFTKSFEVGFEAEVEKLKKVQGRIGRGVPAERDCLRISLVLMKWR